MKLSLVADRGVHVLSVTEQVVAHDIQVVRAGLVQLLKSGKNKVVIELPTTPDLSPDVIRELAAFDLLARELSGRVVLAQVNPALRTKIESFSKPPVIVCFDTREDAVKAISAPPKPEIVEEPGPAAAGAIVGDDGALKELQSRFATLERENRALKDQLVLATIARRVPADEVTYRERIAFLEGKVDQLLVSGGGGAPADKKP